MSELGTTPPAAGAAPGSTPQSVEPASGTTPRSGGQAQVAAPAASAQAAAGPPPQSPAVSLAASLAQAVEGTRLRGVIIGADPDNRPVLRTEAPPAPFAPPCWRATAPRSTRRASSP
jgi:hypothetical protein